MEYKEVDSIGNAYKLAILQNVQVTPIPLGKICGIYNEITPGFYQIFINEDLIDDKKYVGLYDDTMLILMKHHNSSQKGVTKVVTIENMNLFGRLKDEIKRYERKAVEGFLRSISFVKTLSN